MHWLKAWRLNYQRPDGRKGLSRKELARKVRNRDTGCSESLIEIIEGGGITHPGIANRIASVVGATAEQRDTMVHKKHRGTWKPGKGNRVKAVKAPLEREQTPENRRKVVQIGHGGWEMARYESMFEAAREVGCSCTAVMNRCKRRLQEKTNEFYFYNCTFRYADEWDAMSEKERLADLRTGYETRNGGKHESA